MNAVFYHIALTNDADLLKEILKLGEFDGFNVDDIHDVEMYIEASLSDYGSPDLVIKLSDANDRKHIIFFEAKVQGYGGEQRAWEKFQINERYNGYSSNLFYQLYLKQFFMSSTDEQLTDGRQDRLEDTTPRKIGNNTVVLNLSGVLRADAPNIHLCAIIPDDNVENREIEGLPVHFIRWNQIEQLCSQENHQFILDTFNWNGDQIYRGRQE